MYDLFHAGVSMDFVDEVGASLTPGKAAVIADVDEMWVTPIDTRLAALGGTTFRRFPGEVIDDELIRETDAARLELEQLRAELREASGEAKSNVQKAIEAQRQAGGPGRPLRQDARPGEGRVRGAARHAARAAGQRA